MKLTELPRRTAATVETVEDLSPNDAIARRLRELGFVAGEHVAVLARAMPGADPLVVRIGQSTFALRRAEAACVELEGAASGGLTASAEANPGQAGAAHA